jgi:ADP-ribose pyrophosphatase YjhB (NUDIX family)
MTDHTAQTAVRSIDSLPNPEELLDDEAIPVETKHRELDDEKFEALRERYDAMAGVVQFALTTDDGELLMQGWDGASEWAPPGGSVQPGEDWVAGAKRSAKKAFGVELDIDGVLLIEELVFQRADGNEEFSSYGVSFGASLADDDSEFLDDPSFPPESPLADEDMVLRWVTDVPEDINENHREHIEQFLAYAQGK